MRAEANPPVSCTVCGERCGWLDVDNDGVCVCCQPCPECDGYECPLDKCLNKRSEER